ncbi:hypothetical protein AD006_30240 (plasmid) [Pseudonocardia sp. EC080610-09]|uniref:TIGR02679 family protein n=1 Tax=unclassified Pseudonocardia TaxID=2619320 RepID=UPI0007056DB0|nr:MULTISPECIES: TIGR02679 family protein [unclassified Pseudonocardia]ALL79514.1 hypothetical protein AD006_30240 [Pseudonocardia sp. EC080610-09]ALL85534.1 hypothetical protein AD017_31010 [Pseudonocardia sp. EC080619-01]
MPAESSVPAPLDRPELEPLWREIHHRLGTGRPIARIRVDQLDDGGRAALADLLGTVRYPSTPIAFDRLESAVVQIAFLDVRTVVEQLIGPVDDRADRRAKDSAARARLWTWLEGHPLVGQRPALAEWIAGLRRAGIGDVEHARALLTDAVTVLGRLPADGVPLPTFAQQALGRTHALDTGTALSSTVLRGVAALLGADPATDAEGRRELWERMGVDADELSSTVLVAGMRPAGSGLAAILLGASADAGEACVLTLAQVRRNQGIRLDGGAVVHVVENPSIVAMAVDRLGARCPPLVCTNGWPSGAAIRLLRALAARHEIRYHGDLDGDGVRIAAHVVTATGARLWRMGADDYSAHVPEVGAPVGRVGDAPWDSDLAPAMRASGVSLSEEHIAELLLDDLNSSGANNGNDAGIR